jgi:hypothetical protein
MFNLSVVAKSEIAPGRLVDFVHMTESDRRVQPEQPINDLEPFVFLGRLIKSSLREVLASEYL